MYPYDYNNSEKSEEIEKGRLLVEAAAAGDLKKITSLLESGVSVNADEYNKTLFYASKNYMTPLQIAAANDSLECVKVLIDHGADVDAKDRFDVTAVHMTAEKGHYVCLKALLDAGADCSLPTKYSKKGYYTAVPHLGGTTALHLAACNNHVDCVKELIQSGADYNAVDERGRTSLYIAAQAGFDKCVMVHLESAVGRDILSLPGYETGDTPLHFAVRRGMVECVRALLNLGSDVNHLNYAGISPLHCAVTPNSEEYSVSMEILQMLVLSGYNTDINLPDAADLTPLHYVCFNDDLRLQRRPEMAQFLISYGADVNIKNHRGYSLLECEFKSTDQDFTILKAVVKTLLHPPHPTTLNISPQLLNLPRRQANVSPFYALWLAAGHGGMVVQPGPDGDHVPLPIKQNTSLMLQKHHWYNNIVCSPRTLQHYSRYTIRNAMGYRRLRHVKDLPIPVALQLYLLLEYEE